MAAQRRINDNFTVLTVQHHTHLLYTLTLEHPLRLSRCFRALAASSRLCSSNSLATDRCNAAPPLSSAPLFSPSLQSEAAKLSTTAAAAAYSADPSCRWALTWQLQPPSPFYSPLFYSPLLSRRADSPLQQPLILSSSPGGAFLSIQRREQLIAFNVAQIAAASSAGLQLTSPTSLAPPLPTFWHANDSLPTTARIVDRPVSLL